ncbi:MAG TPA: hypothetical protein VMV69_12535 [Pirellulales bacterium]|nr:hypothetical protein [Pirellulales bacterium]
MIELTEQQRSELEKPQPTAIDPQTKQTYVLGRTEAYQRLQALLTGDTVFTTAEMLDNVMADDDANDPHLADLQKQYGCAS